MKKSFLLFIVLCFALSKYSQTVKSSYNQDKFYKKELYQFLNTRWEHADQLTATKGWKSKGKVAAGNVGLPLWQAFNNEEEYYSKPSPLNFTVRYMFWDVLYQGNTMIEFEWKKNETLGSVLDRLVKTINENHSAEIMKDYPNYIISWTFIDDYLVLHPPADFKIEMHYYFSVNPQYLWSEALLRSILHNSRIHKLQLLIGAEDDGIIGSETATMLIKYLSNKNVDCSSTIIKDEHSYEINWSRFTKIVLKNQEEFLFPKIGRFDIIGNYAR